MSDMASYLGWTIDYSQPEGEAAFFAPDSVQWRIYKNPVALGVGGVAAVLLEFADARIRSGVWDHSAYKADPIGRSRRTGIAAMVGVYGPRSAARRVVQGVTNMHAKISGRTPGGEAYSALDPELLDWVSATAAYGFLTAYDRFVAPLRETDKARFWGAGGGELAALYGVKRSPRSTADFIRMMEQRAPRFEPHPIIDEFLAIVQSGRAAPGPKLLHRALARAAVSILPPLAREKLALGADYDLTAFDRMALRVAGRAADRTVYRAAPPCQASLRLGLPVDFLYRSAAEQDRLLAHVRSNAGQPSRPSHASNAPSAAALPPAGQLSAE